MSPLTATFLTSVFTTLDAAGKAMTAVELGAFMGVPYEDVRSACERLADEAAFCRVPDPECGALYWVPLPAGETGR